MTALSAPSPAVPADLLRQRQSELDALFALLPAPTPARAEGVWHGTLMALRGLDRLPRPLVQGLYRLLAAPLNPWRGKSLGGDTGANRWFSVDGAAFGRFRIRPAQSAVDGLPVLLLDYDVPENPALLRAIRGEARRLNEITLLARMNWQGRSGVQRVLYFTLTPAE
jgi:hypothetical protein